MRAPDEVKDEMEETKEVLMGIKDVIQVTESVTALTVTFQVSRYRSLSFPVLAYGPDDTKQKTC